MYAYILRYTLVGVTCTHMFVGIIYKYCKSINGYYD